MDFSLSFLFHLLVLASLDTCWLTLHFTALRGSNLVYPASARSSRSTALTLICCLMCWVVSALYLAGHQQDTEIGALLEGAWTGAVVYAVYNLTTFVIVPDWTMWPTGIIDTLWGTSLFAAASVVATKISMTYY